MYQQIKRIITIVLIVVVLIGALLYFIPWPTRVNLSLNAAKLDKDGNAVGNSTITIKGVMLDYLFQEDCLNVSIYPFDNFKWIKLSNHGTTNKRGIIYPHFQTCKKVYCYTSTDDLVFCKLLFTKDFKYIAFVAENATERTYYVASANTEVSTEELAEYFRYLPPLG